MKTESKHDTTRLNLNARQRMLRAHMIWALAAVALMSVLATTLAAAGGSKDPSLRVFGLTADQRLVKFRSEKPRQLREIGVVSPLQAPDTSLVGIDFRVQDGQLYGVGNAGGIYTIDRTTAAATLVSQLTVPLNGAFFGVDFNPAADRLRIISDTGQNLRHNVNLGGVTMVKRQSHLHAASDCSGCVYSGNYVGRDWGSIHEQRPRPEYGDHVVRH